MGCRFIISLPYINRKLRFLLDGLNPITFEAIPRPKSSHSKMPALQDMHEFTQTFYPYKYTCFEIHPILCLSYYGELPGKVIF